MRVLPLTALLFAFTASADARHRTKRKPHGRVTRITIITHRDCPPPVLKLQPAMSAAAALVLKEVARRWWERGLKGGQCANRLSVRQHKSPIGWRGRSDGVNVPSVSHLASVNHLWFFLLASCSAKRLSLSQYKSPCDICRSSRNLPVLNVFHSASTNHQTVEFIAGRNP